MQQLWGTNKDCYVGKHDLEPESICSILIYLSEVCKTSRYKLSSVGCYLQTTRLVTHVKTTCTCMCPHTVPQSYTLLTMSLSNGCFGSQAHFEPYHSKTAQEYQ